MIMLTNTLIVYELNNESRQRNEVLLFYILTRMKSNTFISYISTFI